MDNLIFCLNVTVPIFLTLLLGYFFRRIGLFDETFFNRMNKFVFVIPLPVLLFQDIAKIDIYLPASKTQSDYSIPTPL